MPDFKIGTIVEGGGEVGSYAVRIENVPDTQHAIPIDQKGLAPGGTRSLNSYLPGDRVLCVYPVDEKRLDYASTRRIQPSAYIVGAIGTAPCSGGSANLAPYDLYDRFYPQGQIYNPSIPVRSGSSRRALPGSAGQVHGSGVEISSNMLEAVLRAGPKAGVEAITLDNMLKVYGLNLWMSAGGSIDRRMTDTGEYSELYMSVPLIPHAKQGALSPPYRPGDIIPQHVHFRGYLGDLSYEAIQIQRSSTQTVTDRSVSPEYWSPDSGGSVGGGARVFEEEKGFDGEYRIGSAKSVTIGKVSPGAPLIIRRNPANASPSHPGGYAPDTIDALGDYGAGSPGYGQYPDTAVDARRLRTFITAPNVKGNYYGMIALGEIDYRIAEKAKTRDHSHLVGEGPEPSFGNGVYDLPYSEHRGTLRYYGPRFSSLWRILDDGTQVWILGDQKTVMGPQSVDHYAHDINRFVGRSDNTIAREINLNSLSSTHIFAEDYLHLGGLTGGTIIYSPLNGYFEDRVDRDWTTIDIKLWGKGPSDTSWTLLKTESGVTFSDQYSEIDLSGVSWENKTLLIELGQDNDNGNWEAIKKDVQIPGGGDGGGSPQMLIAEADMSADDTGYSCKKLDSDGTEGDSITCKRPNGVEVSTDEVGFLGRDTDGDNIFIPAEAGVMDIVGGTHINVSQSGSTYTINESGTRVDETEGLTLETRTDDPTSPETGRIWIRTDLSS